MDVHPPKNGMYRYWSIAILVFLGLKMAERSKFSPFFRSLNGGFTHESFLGHGQHGLSMGYEGSIELSPNYPPRLIIDRYPKMEAASTGVVSIIWWSKSQFPDPFVATSGKIPPFRRHLDRWRRALLVAPWRGFSPKNGWRLQMWECPACFILFDCRAITFITGLILGMVMDISSVKHMKHLLLTWGRLRVCPKNFNPKYLSNRLK
jgi:hypothetical protein